MELTKFKALQMELANAKANLDYLSNAKQEIFELFVEVREKFDGSEYQQGKKDGLRLALALLGNVGMDQFNRGGSQARE